ncbi:MAG: glycosyltransferase family 9 protein [Verrucomicrobiota bacterium]|nr:glycosyltransferase family 9 protein [Verrucomicrobiota bacterium]
MIKPSSLGDIVHTLPAVAAIQAANPQAKLTWVVKPEWATLLRGNPDIAHVHLFPSAHLTGGPITEHLLPWLSRTRALRPDVAIDFQGLLRSALIGRISRARVLYGMSDSREGSRLFYNRIAQVNRGAHAVERYLALAAFFGATITRPLRFPLPTGDPLPRFDDDPPFVLLHPFARGHGKSLGARVIEEFCARSDPIRVVVVGRSSVRITAPDNCIDLTNHTTLLQLIWLIRAARWVISVDSGPMHIAAAISSRVVSIHTWSDPRRVGPYNPDASVWKSGQLMKVAELAQVGDFKKSRPFSRADVAPVAELVQSRWNDWPNETRRGVVAKPSPRGPDRPKT